MCEQLGAAGHDTLALCDGEQSLAELARGGCSLVLTEWALPDMTGLELARRIRRLPDGRDIRVLMVSARDEPRAIAQALEQGFDDYITKPPRAEEFVARVNAVLRRPPLPAVNGVVRVGPVLLDRAAHKVTVAGHAIELAPVEFRLMAFFLENPGRVLDRQFLLEQVWRRRSGIGERTVDVHVRRLRAALEPHGCQELLQTVRGFGYRFG